MTKCRYKPFVKVAKSKILNLNQSFMFLHLRLGIYVVVSVDKRNRPMPPSSSQNSRHKCHEDLLYRRGKRSGEGKMSNFAFYSSVSATLLPFHVESSRRILVRHNYNYSCYEPQIKGFLTVIYNVEHLKKLRRTFGVKSVFLKLEAHYNHHNEWIL